MTVVDVESRRDPAGHELVVPFKPLEFENEKSVCASCLPFA